MRVLIAPQEFKGSLSAVEAARAMARGVRAALPAATLDLLPFSDGGPGFLEALGASLPSQAREVTVRDPLRRPVGALLLEAGDAVFVESAQANGLWRLKPSELDPIHASTEGVGDLLAAAAALRPRRIVVGLGGSATNDGGAGMARALGAGFRDAAGTVLPPGAGPLAHLASVAWDPPSGFRNVTIDAATDVQNHLLRRLGASHIFGSQKGASPDQVEQLDAALARYATVLKDALGVDVTTIPGAGAAGGLAAGLIAFLGAQVVSGFDVVARATGFAARLQQADLVLTGEGRFDAQSSMGKTTGRILAEAAATHRTAIVIAGSVATPAPGIYALVDRAGSEARAMQSAASLLESVTGEAIRRLR